jgi:hypothetical protein
LGAPLDRRDPLHGWAATQLESMTGPMLTCEAVVSECVFLLAPYDPGAARFFALFDDEITRLGFDLDDHLPSVARMLAKYRELPMSLAGACLVRMSELHAGARGFTIDSDFKIYRRNGRQAIPLIFPEA